MDVFEVKNLYDEASEKYFSAEERLKKSCGFFYEDIKEAYLYLGQRLAYHKIMNILKFENEVKMIENEIHGK